MKPMMVQLVLELSRDFPDASVGEIARAATVAESAADPEDLDGLRNAAKPALENFLAE